MHAVDRHVREPDIRIAAAANGQCLKGQVIFRFFAVVSLPIRAGARASDVPTAIPKSKRSPTEASPHAIAGWWYSFREMNLAHAKITTHCFSHIGQRDENQDRLTVLESSGDGPCLLVVADGLGGHAGGSLAAETVVATAKRCWRSRYPEQSPEGFLKLLLRECHNAVRRAGREQALDPHSTIAALLLQDGQAISIHAGDSRVMQYSEKAFVDRTLDHSVAQLHAMRGAIADDEIAQHPDQNKLFAQVGGPSVPEPEIKRWDLSEGRRFVLCSDGFWEIFRHDDIVELFASDDPEAEMKRRFETKLKQLKRHDNTTAILAEVPESSVSRRRSRSAHPAVSMAVAALLMALHAANVAVGQGEGGVDGDTGQGEGAPITATQGEVTGDLGDGETAADGSAGVDANAEPGGLPDGQQESSPVRLQSSDIALDHPIEAGEDISEAVAEELRQRGRLGGGDSLANVSGSRELGETTVLRMRQEHRGIPVFAAEVVVSTLEGRIVRVAGDTSLDIRLDSTAPVNDYASTTSRRRAGTPGSADR